VTGRRLSADTVIRPGMVGPLKPQLLLKRNQSVVIQIEKLGLLVTAVGKTMQEGRVGEYIKVRNIDSQRVILARVNENGTVEPVL
jgi:flagella basal body P-ring formation protein FlgA